MTNRSRPLPAVALALLAFVPQAMAADPAKARKKIADDGLAFDAATFIDLVDDGEIKKVNLFIEAGFDVNAPGARGRTALHEAAEAEDGKLLPVLLKAGARPDVADEQ